MRSTECGPRTTHVVDLAALADNPRPTYRKGAKHALTKAERARGAADVEEYFEVYRDSLRRWGKSEQRAYRAELFRAFAHSPLAETWIVRLPSGEIAAAGVFWFSARHCVWWHGAMRAEFSEACPSNALIHHLLLTARARRATTEPGP